MKEPQTKLQNPKSDGVPSIPPTIASNQNPATIPQLNTAPTINQSKFFSWRRRFRPAITAQAPRNRKINVEPQIADNPSKAFSFAL